MLSDGHMRAWVWVFMFLTPPCLFLLELSAGSVSIPMEEWLGIFRGEASANSQWSFIIWELRLPRAITAVCAGAGLGVSGLLMQTLFQNALAGPFVMGISSGASLGVALVLLGGSAFGYEFSNSFSTTTAASLGAGSMMALVLVMARWVPGQVGLLLMGLMAGYAVGAMVQLLMYFSSAEELQSYTLWSMGHFGKMPLEELPYPITVVGLAIFGSWFCSRPLDIFLQGADVAKSLGVHVGRLRITVMIMAGLLAGTITAICGPIAFLGLAVPHIARRLLKTSRHGPLILACVLVGSSLSLLADWLAQCPGSQSSLPLNAITSIIGAPVVMLVMLRQGVGRS